MIFGALLVVSVILTVVAWTDRNSVTMQLNALQKKYDAVKTSDVHETRKNFHTDIRMQTGVSKGCKRCPQLLNERNGAWKEIRQAYSVMTDKQKAQMQFTYDIIAQKVVVTRAVDAANKDVLQISFTIKNQAKEVRGNMHGLFRFFKGENQVGQMKFDPPDLAPAASKYMQFTTPGNFDWDSWSCNIYPSTASDPTGAPKP